MYLADKRAEFMMQIDASAIHKDKRRHQLLVFARAAFRRERHDIQDEYYKQANGMAGPSSEGIDAALPLVDDVELRKPKPEQGPMGVETVCDRNDVSKRQKVHDGFANVGDLDQPGSLADELWQVAPSLRRLLGDGLAGETLSVTSRIIERVGEAKVLRIGRASRREILAACAGIGCKLSSSYSAELGLGGRVRELWALLAGPDSERVIRLLEPRLVNSFSEYPIVRAAAASELGATVP